MQIDKNMIINMLKEQGNHDQAAQADAELPQQVDPAEHGGLLSKFGLDPQELIAKFAGGGAGGGVGGGVGGMLGNLGNKFG